MLTRRTVVIALAAAAPTSVWAMEKKPFDAAAFRAAQAAGAPILVEVSAPWCSVCKAQEPIIKSLTSRPDFSKLVIFNVDFDSRKDVLQGFKVSRQSTLIVFKGAAEQGRSTGDTSPAGIEALLRKAI